MVNREKNRSRFFTSKLSLTAAHSVMGGLDAELDLSTRLAHLINATLPSRTISLTPCIVAHALFGKREKFSARGGEI